MLLPGGKHKESFDKRAKLMNLLKPYEVTKSQLASLHNPSKGKVKFKSVLGKAKSHVVPFHVPFDKSKVFEYRGRLYDASKMTVNTKKEILGLM